MYIRLAHPVIKLDDFQEELETILKDGILTNGPWVKKFEKCFAQYLKIPYAIATTSATTALHLSLAALDIHNGDEVLVSDFTFPATANVVVQQGARPVFVDIDLDTFNLNYNDLESKITKKTRAIIPVHAFGCPLDMPRLISIAKRNNLFVIEDSACALGSEIGKKKQAPLEQQVVSVFIREKLLLQVKVACSFATMPNSPKN